MGSSSCGHLIRDVQWSFVALVWPTWFSQSHPGSPRRCEMLMGWGGWMLPTNPLQVGKKGVGGGQQVFFNLHLALCFRGRKLAFQSGNGHKLWICSSANILKLYMASIMTWTKRRRTRLLLFCPTFTAACALCTFFCKVHNAKKCSKKHLWPLLPSLTLVAADIHSSAAAMAPGKRNIY